MVSLGSGSAATEMAGDLPCLCLDKDKRAIYSGVVNLKGNFIGKKNNIFHSYFDMRNSQELFSIFQALNTTLPNHCIKILFQHPNPSMKITYKKCSGACMLALKEKIVKEMHFVYDVKEGSTCWNKSEIVNEFVKKKRDKNLFIGHELVICKTGENSLKHPLFGNTVRLGWATMKKGEEHTFMMKF